MVILKDVNHGESMRFDSTISLIVSDLNSFPSNNIQENFVIFFPEPSKISGS